MLFGQRLAHGGDRVVERGSLAVGVATGTFVGRPAWLDLRDDLIGTMGLAITAIAGGGGALLLLLTCWRPPRKEPSTSA